jgi:benzoate transport
MNTAPRGILANLPLSARQVLIISVCVLLIAIDGFDVLSISFAAPGIAAQWGIERAALGVVLSLELLAMAAGSFVLGPIADRIGRRPIVLISLSLVAAGMLATTAVSSVLALGICRLLTGFGIGGMLPSVNVIAAEFTPQTHRNLTVTLVTTGYPLGAVVAGSIAAALLAHYDWRSVFWLGGVLSLLCLPLVWLLIPESLEYLAKKRPADALHRINRTLARFGHPLLAVLPQEDAEPAARKSLLLEPQFVRTTVLLSVAYFGHIMTSYFILKWGAKVVADLGYPAGLAGSVLVWSNTGGLIGCLLFSVLTRKLRLTWLLISVMLGSCLAVAAFGQGLTHITQLSIAAALAGFFTQAGIVGLYALVVQAYPTEVRTGGFGLVMAIGRGGAALSPIVAGLMFQSGVGLSMVAAAMSMGSLIAIAALLVFARR